MGVPRGPGMKKFGSGKNERRIRYKYFGPSRNKIGLSTNKNLLIFNFLRFEDKGRIHIIHEELRGSLLEKSRAVGQQLKDGATAPGQRRPQCGMTDLSFLTT